jgi:hypothetical protein
MCGGGPSVVQTGPQVAPETPEQRELAQLNIQNIRELQPTLRTINALTQRSLSGQQIQPDFNSMYQPGLQRVGQSQNTIDALQRGELPSAFTQNQQSQVNQAMRPFYSGLNSLAQRGVLNSSLTKDLTREVADSVSNAQMNNYNQNLSTMSQLANQQQQSALAPANYGAAYQQAATYLPTTYTSLMSGNYAPQQTMYGQLLNQQTALSAPAQTSVTQSSSPFGSILGTGLGVWAGKKWG